jgi:hypothetical protein
VGPVKARFKGRLQQKELQPPQRYTLTFEGDAGMAGFAKGSAEVELSEGGENSTLLAYRAQAQIGGRLAQIGSRLVDATAARMSQQFFDRLTEVISAPAKAAVAQSLAPAPGVPSAPAPAAAPAGWSGMVTIAMPGWAWACTLAAVLAAVWFSTH